MCGRFTQYFTWSQLVELYGLTQSPLNLEPRYNIAPTTQILAVRGTAGGRTVSRMTWGLMPAWHDDPKPPKFTFNARAEGIEGKPMWRGPFKSARCIIPMSGFFEWRRDGEAKRPFHVTMADRGIMSVAGLWASRTHAGVEELSCTLITTRANGTMAPIHDRMPVIVDDEDMDRWLSGAAGPDFLTPCPDEWIEATEVSSYVNAVRNQGERCIEPAS